jgi:hypothetical protein
MAKTQPLPPREQPLLDGDRLSWAYYQWLATVVTPKLNAPVSFAAPATSTSPGTFGQVGLDQNFLYVCVTTNLWRRIPLSAF